MGLGYAQSNPAVNQPRHPFVRGHILVKFKDGVSDSQARNILKERGARSINVLSKTGVHIVELPPNADEKASVAALRASKEIDFAEVDRILTPQSITPNDYYYFIGYQWGLSKISAPGAWSITTGSSNIVIAVIDSGVDSTQPDLQGRLVAGWNIFDNNANTADVGSHGTSVAGIVGASTNNGIGVAGVCWTCMIMPVRVTGPDQSVTYSNIAAGITWAADHGARVANVAFVVDNSSTVTVAAQYMQSKGGVVTVAAGDYGWADTNPINPSMITVGATDQNDAIYSWSNRGSDIVLVAPGQAETTLPFGMYQSVGGTSISSPFVAGVAGLMLSVNPSLTAAQVTNMLEQTADPLGVAGWDPTFGYGRLNAAAAVKAAAGMGSKNNSTTTLNANLNPSIVGQSVTFTAVVTPSAATGTITFLDGTLVLGTGTLSGGVATFSSTALSAGAHSITATYGGDSNDTGGSSAALSHTVSIATKATTTSAVISSLNPAIAGQLVTFTASVLPSSATGTVTLFDGSSTLGTASLSSGRATFTAVSLAAGSHSISASYGGDSNDNSSTSAVLAETVNAVVTKTNTTISLSSNLNPSTAGQTVTFTSAITPSSATGIVTFYDGMTALGVATSSGGIAAWSTASLAAGSHSITATYSGDSKFNGSSSGAVTQNVTVAKASPPSISSLTASPSAITQGQSSTLSWNVSGATTISINNGVGTVSGSSVSVSPSQTTTYTLTASNSAGSASAQVMVTVTSAATGSPLITAFPASATFGQTITISGRGFLATNIIWINSPGIGVHGLRVASIDGTALTFMAGAPQQFSQGVNTLNVSNDNGQSNTVTIMVQ
jgi:thermitase